MLERQIKYQWAGELSEEILYPNKQSKATKGYSSIGEHEGPSTLTDLGLTYRELNQALLNVAATESEEK